jgi:peroxiredoxin
MSKNDVHTGVTVSVAASLAAFTDDLIARRGVEQANLLFDGQIGPATKALSECTTAIGVGDHAPDFSLPSAETKTWHLAEHLALDKFSSLVVVFYRGTWCPYCNIYLRGLLQALPLLVEANSALIAVAPEAPKAPSDEPSATELTYPVLIDHGGKIAERFGLSFEMDEIAKSLLKIVDIDLEKRNADGKWILPVPGTFVIDRSGHVAYAHVDADYRNRPEPQEIVAMCRSLQG